MIFNEKKNRKLKKKTRKRNKVTEKKYLLARKKTKSLNLLNNC